MGSLHPSCSAFRAPRSLSARNPSTAQVIMFSDIHNSMLFFQALRPFGGQWQWQWLCTVQCKVLPLDALCPGGSSCTACILRTQRLGYSPKNTSRLSSSTAKQQSPHHKNETAFNLVINCRYEQANQPCKVQLCKGMQDAHMFKWQVPHSDISPGRWPHNWQQTPSSFSSSTMVASSCAHADFGA